MNAPTLSPGPICPARWYHAICPSGVLALLMGAGVALELVLLHQVPEHIFTDGGRLGLIGVGLVVWFWWSVVWLFWAGTRGVRRLATSAGVLGWPIRVLAVLLASGAVVAYLSSWAVYFHSGRFSNIEAIRFGWENAQTSWFWYYLLESEVRSLLLGLGVFLAAAAAIPILAWGVSRSPSPSASPLLGSARLALWIVFTFVLIQLPGRLIASDEKLMRDRRDGMLDAVRNSAHPFSTLAYSIIGLWVQEPIEPCLDTGELTPRTTAYRPSIPEGKRPPSVVVVAVESLRSDVVHLRHQGREVTPHLNALARKGLECRRAYSQSTHSDYADVCIVSSLYPLRTRRHHYYRTNDPWPKTLLYDVLKPLGYSTAIISSQNERWGSMDRFLASPNLDLFYDAERSDVPDIINERDLGMRMALEAREVRRGKLADRHTADAAIRWVEQQVTQDRPFFLSMNLQSSHFPYTLPPGVEAPFQPAEIDFDASFLHYPPEKTEIVRNAYFNAVHECDRQLGRLVEALRRLGRLDDTILVVVGENGEAFHENGTVTHAREPVEPALRVACVWHHPATVAPGVEDYPVELIDVAPTILALLGQPAHPNFQGIDFRSGSRRPASQRLLFFHVENGLARADAVLLGGRWKLHLDRNRSRTQLFDVINDPGETKDLTEQKPELAARLREHLQTWRRRQLAYYHFPQYYQGFFPPAPPRWEE